MCMQAFVDPVRAMNRHGAGHEDIYNNDAVCGSFPLWHGIVLFLLLQIWTATMVRTNAQANTGQN